MTGNTNHAIVIGASMGGIMAARVLADAFDRVTVIERDALPAGDEYRRGVPQARHTHGLLVKGARTLEEIFPGFTAAVEKNGGRRGDPASSVVSVYDGHPAARQASDLRGVVASRPLLEGTARRMLTERTNVTIVDRTQVTRLLASPARDAVTGVVTVPDGGGDETECSADLVVDTTGRGSRSAAWLETLGYERPREDAVKVDIAYTTRIFRRDPASTLTGVIISASPECPRLGAMLYLEGDRWMVTLGGYLGEEAPTELEAFRAFARKLPSPHIADIIATAEPVGEAVATKYPASRRLRYEELKRFPAGYLVLGDAICSFNPVYGQGMSVAGWQALALRDALRGGTDGLAQRFFKQAAKAIDIPWSIAVGNDLRIPGVQGKRTPAMRFISWYVARLNRLAVSDPVVAQAFRDVVHMVAAPPSIMRPAIARRVLFSRARPNAISAAEGTAPVQVRG